jgi:putative copper resistance protein D
LNTLFDIFGFASVVLRGLELVTQTVLLGSVLFALLIAVPFAPVAGFEALWSDARRVIRVAAIATLATVIVAAALKVAVLAATLGSTFADAAGARFVLEASMKVLAAIVIVVSTRSLSVYSAGIAMAICSAVILTADIGSSHAAARLTDSALLTGATAAHELGAALWLGGLPCLRMALAHIDNVELATRIGRCYSAIAATGVALIAAGAVIFSLHYIGSPSAAYGTAYGAMAATKTALFGALLLLGFANFYALHRIAPNRTTQRRVVRFVEVEMGIGFAVLMAAASITSMPPAVDLTHDRVSLAEIAARMAPAMPRLESPDHATLGAPALQAKLDAERRRQRASTQAFVPGSEMLAPRNAQDVAWSEYNHHWAGLLVAAMGLAALAQRSGRAPWTRHWPLLFLLLAAFLFLRADPEVWPMGNIGLIESLKDPEVAQHRLFVLVIVVFALFEWRVRTGRIVSHNAARVFPLLTAVGGTLLLTHSHALGNVKEELLIEMTHLPIAVLGIAAGWTRWLEVEAPNDDGRWSGWIWLVCFVLIGLLLLDYREA